MSPTRKLGFIGLLLLCLVATQNVSAQYQPVDTYDNYDDSFSKPFLVMDGANYEFHTSYGVYSILQPLNLISFSDYRGIKSVDQSVFIIQENSSGTWLPLLGFYDSKLGNPVVVKVNDTYFELNYNIYDKNVKIADAKLIFKSYILPYIKPKIHVEVTMSKEWDARGFKDFRWIWDIKPNNKFQYYRNDAFQTKQVISIKKGLVSVSNGKKMSILKVFSQDTFAPNLGSLILDVSDYNRTEWFVGDSSNWNGKSFVTIFPVNENIIDPTVYSEYPKEEITPVGTSGWISTDAGSAPANSVAEIISFNVGGSSEHFNGARNTTSVLERKFKVFEAEGGGGSSTRWLCGVDGNGNVTLYRDSFNMEYYLVGYWFNVTFNEQWEIYSDPTLVGWIELDGSNLNLQINRTHLITLGSENLYSESEVGVRNTSSILNRVLDVMEAESGGNSTGSLFVQTDSSGNIDIYQESNVVPNFFMNQGYFDATTHFYEDMTSGAGITTGNIAWGSMSGSNVSSVYGVPMDAIVDIWNQHGTTSAETTVGSRSYGSSNDRSFLVREAESGGDSGYGSLLQLTQGTFEGYGLSTRYYYTGWFNFTEISTNIAPTISSMTFIDLTDGVFLAQGVDRYYTLQLVTTDPDGASEISLYYVGLQFGDSGVWMNLTITSSTSAYIFTAGEDIGIIGEISIIESGTQETVSIPVQMISASHDIINGWLKVEDGGGLTDGYDQFPRIADLMIYDSGGGSGGGGSSGIPSDTGFVQDFTPDSQSSDEADQEYLIDFIHPLNHEHKIQLIELSWVWSSRQKVAVLGLLWVSLLILLGSIAKSVTGTRRDKRKNTYVLRT